MMCVFVTSDISDYTKSKLPQNFVIILFAQPRHPKMPCAIPGLRRTYNYIQDQQLVNTSFIEVATDGESENHT